MKKIGVGLLLLAVCLALVGCKSNKKYHATFNTITSFSFIDDGDEYAEIIHEGDELIFSDLIEEDGVWYASFPYRDTPEVRVSLGKKISDTEYEFATVEYK